LLHRPVLVRNLVLLVGVGRLVERVWLVRDMCLEGGCAS
jgi:hypothetical protein